MTDIDDCNMPNGRWELVFAQKLTVCSESLWGCLKIHVDLLKNEKTKMYELSAFQNIKNYQNRPNNEGERSFRAAEQK